MWLSDVEDKKLLDSNNSVKNTELTVDTISHQKATLDDAVLPEVAMPNDTVLKQNAADDDDGDDVPLQPDVEDPEGNKGLDDIDEHEIETGIVTSDAETFEWTQWTKLDSEMSRVELNEVSTRETEMDTANVDISESQTWLELSDGDSEGVVDDSMLESVNCNSTKSPNVCQETSETLCDRETSHSIMDTDPVNIVSESDGLSDVYNSLEVANPDSQSSSQEIIGECYAAVTGDCSTVSALVFIL